MQIPGLRYCSPAARVTGQWRTSLCRLVRVTDTQINLTLSDRGSFKWNSTPVVEKDSSALPSDSYARTLFSSIVPKPVRDGGFTAGPPFSRHVKSTSVGFAAGFATQEIATRPVSIDRAPYFAAFVTSSWNARASVIAVLELSHIVGPAMSMCAVLPSRTANGATAVLMT